MLMETEGVTRAWRESKIDDPDLELIVLGLKKLSVDFCHKEVMNSQHHFGFLPSHRELRPIILQREDAYEVMLTIFWLREFDSHNMELDDYIDEGEFDRASFDNDWSDIVKFHQHWLCVRNSWKNEVEEFVQDLKRSEKESTLSRWKSRLAREVLDMPDDPLVEKSNGKLGWGPSWYGIYVPVEEEEEEEGEGEDVNDEGLDEEGDPTDPERFVKESIKAAKNVRRKSKPRSTDDVVRPAKKPRVRVDGANKVRNIFALWHFDLLMSFASHCREPKRRLKERKPE